MTYSAGAMTDSHSHVERGNLADGVANIGLMLYTVRAECRQDLEGTLRSVAALGYTGVEVSELHGHSVSSVRRWLDASGLRVAGMHARLEAMTTRLPALAGACAELETNRLLLSWIEPPENREAAKRTAARLSELGRAASTLGLQLGFHNHVDELHRLEGGGTFLDELLASGDVFLEIDLGWAWIAGLDVGALLERAAARCPLVHVKDFASREARRGPAGELSYDFRPVGDGVVPYEDILPAAVAAGVEWLLVEQDETEGSALDAAARSLERIRGIVAPS
jgi:sugar phosphate isomerase/epimerase